jgi:nucleoside 2-deoxyribosyltransferase
MKAPPTAKQAFVAMWFDASMSDAYTQGIAPGIVDAGYEPLRIDRKDHNNRIDDEIISEIRRSRFLVADFTSGDDGPRGGVYYEAGFAHGMGIPVIFACRSGRFDKLHFDTRQYNHIGWTTPSELREALSRRISATIGDGPNRKLS